MYKSSINENDIFLTSSNIINEICEPLKKIGINYFTYLKKYLDGSQVNLSNSSKWIEDYYNFKLYNSSWFEASPKEYNSGYILWPDEVNSEVFKHGREYFDSANGITIIQKADLFTEFFFFSGSVKNKSLNSIYLNGKDVLDNFIRFFKEQLKDIIEEAENSRIYIPTSICKPLVEELEVLDLYNDEVSELNALFTLTPSINVAGKTLVRNTFAFLSTRETEVVNCMLRGETAKQTARTLGISHRTVERHLDNIKDKMQCKTKFELVNKLIKPQEIETSI